MSSVDELLAQADHLRQEGHYRQAIVLYDAILQNEPGQRAALVGKGWALFYEGDKINSASYDEALGYLQTALQADENDVAILREYANALIKTGAISHWNTATQVCDKILRLVPGDVQGLTDQASVLYRLGRNEDCIEVCNQILELDADTADGWRYKGWALYSVDRYEEAIACFDQALKLDPKLAAVLAFRGLMLMKLGQFEQALASINRALELEPGYATALCFKIDVLEAMGKHDEAQKGIEDLPPIEYHF